MGGAYGVGVAVTINIINISLRASSDFIADVIVHSVIFFVNCKLFIKTIIYLKNNNAFISI